MLLNVKIKNVKNVDQIMVKYAQNVMIIKILNSVLYDKKIVDARKLFIMIIIQIHNNVKNVNLVVWYVIITFVFGVKLTDTILKIDNVNVKMDFMIIIIKNRSAWNVIQLVDNVMEMGQISALNVIGLNLVGLLIHLPIDVSQLMDSLKII